MLWFIQGISKQKSHDNHYSPIIIYYQWNLTIIITIINHYWLVVSTPLKNISQWEGLSHILWKKND